MFLLPHSLDGILEISHGQKRKKNGQLYIWKVLHFSLMLLGLSDCFICLYLVESHLDRKENKPSSERAGVLTFHIYQRISFISYWGKSSEVFALGASSFTCCTEAPSLQVFLHYEKCSRRWITASICSYHWYFLSHSLYRVKTSRIFKMETWSSLF